MNIASEPMHSSLRQRIAKIQNCMRVEVATGISATNKDLFVSLCQTYEQRNRVTSCLTGESHESLPNGMSSISNLTQKATQPRWPTSIVGRNILLWQRGTGFLVTDRSDFGWVDDDVGFSDWDKWVGFLVTNRATLDDTEEGNDEEDLTN